jgi:hypothetical protein
MTELQMSMMEAGSEPPAPPPADPPPPPPPPPPPSDRASRGRRALAFLGFLVLAFGCAVVVVAAADIGKTPTCADVNAHKADPYKGKCFDGGSTKKAVSVGLMWPGGVLAGVAALLALVFTVTGRNGRRVMLVTAAAIVVSGLGILIGSI